MNGALRKKPIPCRVAERFPGLGGFRLALERTRRFRTVLSSEIDDFARQTDEKNFGKICVKTND